MQGVDDGPPVADAQAPPQPEGALGIGAHVDSFLAMYSLRTE